MSSPGPPDRPGEWAAIAVDFLEDEAISRLSPVQVLVYLGAILHSTRLLTDGRITRRGWGTIIAQAGADRRAVTALEKAGLITKPDEHGDSVLVSYLRWNASKAYREEERRKGRERVRAHRERKRNEERNALRSGPEGEVEVLQARQGLEVDQHRDEPRPGESASEPPAASAVELERDELETSGAPASVHEVTTPAAIIDVELELDVPASLETRELLGEPRSGSSSAPGEPAQLGPDVERFLAAIRAKAARGG